MNKAFAVDFKCKNCGNEWKKQFRAETRVKRGRAPFYGVRVMTGDRRKRSVECPVCELTETVSVEDRNPL